MFVFRLLVTLLFISVVGCAGSDSSSTSSANGLSETVPGDFAVSSPFTSDSSSAKLATKGIPINFSETEPEDIENVRDKIERINALIEADTIDECTFDFGFFRSVYSPQCYGPTLDYTDHPDDGMSDGQLPSGDLGIWTESETVGSNNIPCIKVKLDELIGKVEERIDFATQIFHWMLCVAKVRDVDTLPEAGTPKNLTQTLNDAVTDASFPINITSATMQKQDDCEDKPQYLSNIQGTITDGAKSVDIDISMRHTRRTADNSTYSGRIWSTLKSEFGTEGNCGGAEKKMIATSIGYERPSASELRAEIASAEYCNDTGDPFTTSKALDADNTYDSSSNPEGWAANYNAFLTNHNPNTGTSKFNYKWKAGRLDDLSRNLYGSIGPDDNDLIEGCGYFGFSPTLTMVDNDGNIDVADRLVCNWAGPANNHTGVTQVQRQCVKENASSGLLESDSSLLKITYAPTNSCSSPGAGETFGGSGAAITADLLAIDDVSFSAAVAPDICGE